MRSVRFTSLARQDVDAAYEWYEAARPGLGDALLMSLEAALGRVVRFPHAAAAYHGGVRRVPLRRFPYAVYYAPRERSIDVIGVRPFAGDPAALLPRLPG